MGPGGINTTAVMWGQSAQRIHIPRTTFRCVQRPSVISPLAWDDAIPSRNSETAPSQASRPVLTDGGLDRYATFDNATSGSRGCPPPTGRLNGAITLGCNQNSRVGRYFLRKNTYFRLASKLPPGGVRRNSSADRLRPVRTRETFQAGGCRRVSGIGLAPEPCRRLSALEPGRCAPAGSCDSIFDRLQDLRVRGPVHVRSPFRQAHK